MIYGAITNSWRIQLEDHDLRDLVKEAQARGARHVELRQTCLGNCEFGEGQSWRPEFANLSDVVGSFTDLSFNLALAWPCLTAKTDPSGEQFQSALEAADLVNPDSPHLRLVDPTQFDLAWETPNDLPENALALADLAREAADKGITLSIENSGQPIRSLELLVNDVRAVLSEEQGRLLGLCPDPTNQLRRFPGSDPIAELEALPVDMIKIVHFKQTRDGEPIPVVNVGDQDCVRMMNVLKAKQYDGPVVMEIPPHKNVFDNLSSSFAYLWDELETGRFY